MAKTVTYSGEIVIKGLVKMALSGDAVGDERAVQEWLYTLAAAGGTAPTISGVLCTSFTVDTSGAILIAHATDPTQGFGSATYSQGFAPAGTKVKAIGIKNTGATNSLVVTRTASVGFALFDAAADAMTIAPGDCFFRTYKAGSAALSTGSNDSITLAPSADTTTCALIVIYGP